MNNRPIDDGQREKFRRRIRSEEDRKVRVSARGNGNALLGIGMFGIVGWTVALPTVVGAIVGAWLDRTHPAGHSWTLALLVAGLMIGCFQAWRWVAQEEEAIHREDE